MGTYFVWHLPNVYDVPKPTLGTSFNDYSLDDVEVAILISQITMLWLKSLEIP